MHNPALLTTLAAFLATLPAAHAGMYPKNSPVLQLNARDYEKLIVKSNQSSIVEFYAPWCGHCQNLKPAYEKAARDLDGIAKVAAIDCDDAANKPFCGTMGVRGFPTLKTIRPSKTGGRPVVEDYQGARTAKAITEAVFSKINNYVARVSDADIDGFLEGEGPKVLLFSQKGATSALLRSIAIDFLGVVPVGQVRDTQKASVDKFGITNFPTLVLVPGGDKEPIVYSGELKKKPILKFLSQVAQPNPDPAPNDKSKSKSKSKAEESKDKPKNDKPKDDKPKADKESKSDETSSSSTKPAERATPSLVPIAKVTSLEEITKPCLVPHAHTCVLAFTPSDETELGVKAIGALDHLNTKYTQGRRSTFPFFSVPNESEAASTLPKSLELSGDVNLVAINVRRGWWRHYQGDFSQKSVENWVDAIRMGEGEKKKLPKSIIGESNAKESEEEVEHNEL